MSVSQLTRNLRDGELVIKDGAGTPKTLTVILDQETSPGRSAKRRSR